jgi:hypothetical protein
MAFLGIFWNRWRFRVSDLFKNYEFNHHSTNYVPGSPGRSGTTNGIVMKAKMCAGRRQKLFRQETGWRDPNYAGVSVI